MAKKFMDKNFLLETKTAQKLYHNYAKNKMIYDYHCHLSPQEIYEDKKYSNIAEIWLSADHYKWRYMRSAGMEEKYCTGNATDYEKFVAYHIELYRCRYIFIYIFYCSAYNWI